MAQSISAEIVEATWKRIGETSETEAPLLVEKMKAEQPELLAYLIALDDELFNIEEQEVIFYVGMVIWQIMKQSQRRLMKVSRKKLRQAEEENYNFLDLLSTDTEADFMSATALMIEDYPEPEVFRYLVEAIMEEEDETDEVDKPVIREDVKGMAFIHLKIILDVLVRSLV